MSKANILVVDDQESIRHFVSKALTDEGYTVATTKALDAMRRRHHGHAVADPAAI